MAFLDLTGLTRFKSKLDTVFKKTQTAVSDPSASGTATAFISGITQNAQGVITPSKKNLPSASTSNAGIVQLNNTFDSTSTTQAATAATVASLNDNIVKLQECIAIIVDGDTASVAVPVGWFAYIKNNAHGLTDGIYKNVSSSTFPVSGGTANSTVFAATQTGAVNLLNNNFATQYTNASVPSNVTVTRNDVYKRAGVVFISIVASKSQWNEGDTVAIIPNGYRPITTLYVPFANYNSTTNNNILGIDGDGNIKIWSKGTQPTGNIYISATFFAD